MHWATPLIGREWSQLGEGPELFSCWGLVRHVYRERHGIDLPTVAVADPSADNVRSIKQVVQLTGLRRVDGPARDGDLIVMSSTAELHCGLVLAANGLLGVLHSSRGTGVRWERYGDATAGVAVELWRRAQ